MEQLAWCKQEGVRRVIITHCGSAIVKGDEHRIKETLRDRAADCGIALDIASDGMELTLP